MYVYQLYKYCTSIVHILYNDRSWSCATEANVQWKYDENSVQKVDAYKNIFVHLHRQCRLAQTWKYCVMY